MDLTLQDKNELLKAAIKSTDRDIAVWLADIVTRFDEQQEDGKRMVACPPYKSNGHAAEF